MKRRDFIAKIGLSSLLAGITSLFALQPSAPAYTGKHCGGCASFGEPVDWHIFKPKGASLQLGSCRCGATDGDYVWNDNTACKHFTPGNHPWNLTWKGQVST